MNELSVPDTNIDVQGRCEYSSLFADHVFPRADIRKRRLGVDNVIQKEQRIFETP